MSEAVPRGAPQPDPPIRTGPAPEWARRSGLDALAEPDLATPFDTDPSRSLLSSFRSKGRQPVWSNRPPAARDPVTRSSQDQEAPVAAFAAARPQHAHLRDLSALAGRGGGSNIGSGQWPLRAIASALFPGLRLVLWLGAGGPAGPTTPSAGLFPELPGRSRRVGTTLPGHVVHEFERLSADRHQREHSALAMVPENALIAGMEDPGRGARGAEREHGRLAAELGPAALADPYHAAHLPGRAPDHEGEWYATKRFPIAWLMKCRRLIRHDQRTISPPAEAGFASP